MLRIVRHLVIAGLLVIALSTVASAANNNLVFQEVDNLALNFRDSVLNVWAPVVAMLAMIGLVANMFFGFFHIGPKLLGFVFGMAVLTLGLPTITTLLGGDENWALGATLHPIEIVWTVPDNQGAWLNE